jgi:hypothetical protein
MEGAAGKPLGVPFRGALLGQWRIAFVIAFSRLRPAPTVRCDPKRCWRPPAASISTSSSSMATAASIRCNTLATRSPSTITSSSWWSVGLPQQASSIHDHGRDFWGMRVGIRNVGTWEFEKIGYVFEIGNGVW